MSLNVRILLSLIKLGAPYADLSVISKDARVPVEVVRTALRKLADDHLIQLDEGSARVSSSQRLDLAVLALKGGADIERVCQDLGWQEFEDLVALILEANSFSTQKHYRFRTPSRRFEIDVLGLKKPLVLLLECKRWTKSWQRSATMKIVETHLARTKAFLNAFHEVRESLGLAGWSEAWLLPLILTLSETPLKTYQQVPVIPIFYFHAFITDEVHSRLDEAAFYTVVDGTTSQPASSLGAHRSG